MKKIIAMLLVLAMALSLVACGGGETASDGVVLDVVIAQYTDHTAEWWAEFETTFEAANEDIDLNIEVISWNDITAQISSRIQTGEQPDILNISPFSTYVGDDLLVPVDDYISDTVKANIIPSFYEANTVDGTVWALPILASVRCLFVNKDILAQAGVEAIPTTWEELAAACDAVLANCPGVIPLVQDWGNPHYGSLNEIFWPYFWSAGGEIVDDAGNLTINSAEGLVATELLYDMAQKGYLGANATACDDVKVPFSNGEAAFVFMASGNALKLEGINWEYVTALQGPQDAETFVAADSLVMFESCENKELAAKLMKYLTSSDVMSRYHKTITDQPPITADEEYTGSEKYAGLFTDDAGMLRSLPVFKGASSMYDALYKNIQSMMLGELTPEEVLTKTTEYYDSNLK